MTRHGPFWSCRTAMQLLEGDEIENLLQLLFEAGRGLVVKACVVDRHDHTRESGEQLQPLFQEPDHSSHRPVPHSVHAPGEVASGRAISPWPPGTDRFSSSLPKTGWQGSPIRARARSRDEWLRLVIWRRP